MLASYGAPAMPLAMVGLPMAVYLPAVYANSESSPMPWNFLLVLVLFCSVLFWGFDSLADPRNSTNTPFSLLMLAVTYSIIPAMFKFVAMPLFWNYPLTEERVADVQAQILTQGKDRAEPQQHS